MADSNELSGDVSADAVPATPAYQTTGQRYSPPGAPPELCATNVPPKAMSPSDNDEDVEKYRHKFPKHLRFDYYDAMVLYHDSDRPAVRKFLERFKTGSPLSYPSIVLYDEVLPFFGNSPVNMIDKVLPNCNFVFLYVTREFCEDDLFDFSSSTCIMNSILVPHQKWSVVPIFTEPKRTMTAYVPASIMSLRGIQYSGEDKFDLAPVLNMFKYKPDTRQQNDELKDRRHEWIRKKKETERQEAEERRKKESLAESKALASTTTELEALKLQQDRDLVRQSQLQGGDNAAMAQTFQPQGPARSADPTSHVVQTPSASCLEERAAEGQQWTDHGSATTASRTAEEVMLEEKGPQSQRHIQQLLSSKIKIGSANNIYIAENIVIHNNQSQPKCDGGDCQGSSEKPNTS